MMSLPKDMCPRSDPAYWGRIFIDELDGRKTIRAAQHGYYNKSIK